MSVATRPSKRPRSESQPADVVQGRRRPHTINDFATAYTNSIPLDIVNALCSYFYDDISTAKACAGTCRTWYTIVQPFIYRTVKLTRPSQVHQLESFLDANPFAGYWIRRLRIEYSCLVTPSDTWFKHIGRGFRQKLHQVSTLVFLNLNCKDWDDNDSAAFLCLLSYFSDVSHFSLVYCVLPSTLMTASLLTFNYHIHLSNVYDTVFPAQTQLNIPFQHSLQPSSFHYSLTIPNWTCGDALFVHLMRMFTPGEVVLTTFEILICRFYCEWDYSSALRAAGSNLRHLKLTWNSPGCWDVEKHMVEPERLKELDLSLSTELRTFELHPFNHPATLDLLSNIRSPHIEKFIFSLAFNSPKCLNDKKFQAIDECLTRPLFKSLRLVRFLYTGPLREETVDFAIRRIFSNLAMRDVVRVVKVKNTKCAPNDG